jgi:hypothetical protein
MSHIDPDSRLGRVVLAVGLPIFAALLAYQMLNFGRAFRSCGWPAAQRVIVESVVERARDVHGLPHSKAKVRYTYAPAGRQLENKTIAFGVFRGILTWGYANATVERFPKARGVSVYYDPDDPEVSCLQQGGLAWEDCLMLLIGIAGTTHGARALRKAIRWLSKRRHLTHSMTPKQVERLDRLECDWS